MTVMVSRYFMLITINFYDFNFCVFSLVLVSIKELIYQTSRRSSKIRTRLDCAMYFQLFLSVCAISKRRFYSFMEFYVILKKSRSKNLIKVPLKQRKTLD